MRRTAWAGGAALLTLLLASCGNDNGPDPIQPGDLLVSYYQGGPEAGALMLTITGGVVQSVTAVGGQQVSSAIPFSGTTKVIIAGNLTTGDVLRLRVPDVAQSTNYRVQVDQVADKVTFALLNPDVYTFTVHR